MLFDSWFSTFSSILALKNMNLDVITLVKKTPKVHFFTEARCFLLRRFAHTNPSRVVAHVIFSQLKRNSDRFPHVSCSSVTEGIGRSI